MSIVKRKRNFDELVEAVLKENKLISIRPVIEKEILHYDILFSLQTSSLLKDLVFQGGTSLRLCHGSRRYSEDLDFVGGQNFNSNKVKEIKECLEDYITHRYGFNVTVKEPKILSKEKHRDGINIDAWQISIATSPLRDVKKQRIKLEIANVDAYTSEFKKLKNNYSVLPDAYDEILINMESLDEIKADKIVSLTAVTEYTRNRDIWDLLWLSQRTGVTNFDLVSKKIADYNVESFEQKLDKLITNIEPIIGHKSFKDEMSRFLDSDAISKFILNDDFNKHLGAEVKAILQSTQKYLFNSSEQTPKFKI